MATDDLVLASFEIAADTGRDLTAATYQRFYQRCPEARAVMSHVDPYMQGRMLDEVLQLLMTPEEALDPAQLAFELANHRAYGTRPEQYRPLLEAVRDTMAETLQAAWTEAVAAAWDRRLAGLLQRIEQQA